MSLSVSTKPNHTPELRAQIDDWVASLSSSFLSCIVENDDSRVVSSTNRASGVEKRQQEYATGRRCAESLLKKLGNGEQVWTNPDRSPKWPKGFAGSISHSPNWVWAAVGKSWEVLSIGIDTESVATKQTREQIQFEIATPREMEVCQSIQLSTEQIFTVAFSAKEAFFKCCYPLFGEYFGFEHASIESATNSQLEIKTLPSHPCLDSMPTSLNVHYIATESDVFTITWMEPTLNGH